ncbi:MAG: FkbM family methyltransferase [Chloroflexi bacterium]|nr:FkbM family methyltransferase [Chloroflexota bacterium]
MKLGEKLIKPEYFFRPGQVFLRLARSFRPCPAESVTVTLPWRLPLRISPSEDIGRQIWLLGVIDLSLTEVLWRLTDAGDTAVDIGANIGYTASILAARSGPTGRVIVFEPHPMLFDELTHNLRLWDELKTAPVQACRVALSDVTGTSELNVPEEFSRNRGVATFESSPSKRSVPVTAERLDNLIATPDPVGMIKIDVEGHELKVLHGMQKLLSHKQIRDIVFEESRPYPTAVTEYLEAYGFKIFSLGMRLGGPVIQPANQGSAPHRRWAPQNLVATQKPDRAVERFKALGWKSLRSQT